MSRQSTFTVTAVVVIAVLAALVITEPFETDDEPAEVETASVQTRAADSEELAQLAESSGYPIYWLEERAGEQIELTEVGDGRVYVRYLPEGAEVGDPRADFITIGSFEHPDALGRLDALANHPRSVREETDAGRIAVFPAGQRFRAYAVDPEYPEIQVEVFHPEPDEAMRLLVTGAVQPIEP